MASVKELMEKQLNKSFEGTKKNRLVDKLPAEEIESLNGGSSISIKPQTNEEKIESKMVTPTAKRAKKREAKPIGIMIYLDEDSYDLFDTMLNKGKRKSKSELSLTFQQGELVALMTDFYHANVFSNKDLFNKQVLEIVSQRKNK